MSIVVSARKNDTPGALVSYTYWMNEDIPRKETFGLFTYNSLTGKFDLVTSAKDDESKYGYSRIVIKIKRLYELQGEFPNRVVWSDE